ncbi:abortive infection protein [Brachyspira hampsonii 30446]|uniref:Abortive infection protein n=2 Tax=Brachyspira hampsonii TaxID=1287055 RepID=A0A2U4FNE6_9SPIR|nr:AAA family ATPase [Brachyspira hampsonii]EKV56663.1 abortive infection protein [Brachyspira hampsonii 30446]MBW5394240.1 abortive infection protein [Brachyspira hampsonii]
MLVKFSVENYKSIYDKIELDFRINPENYDNEESINNNPFVLKINNDYISKLCLFYGHNGSGKTNIFEAVLNLCLSNVNNSFLYNMYKPNIIYGENEESKFEIEFYSNVLNENKNEYSLYNYKLNVKNKEIDDEYKKSIQITKEILTENGNIVFERKNNDLIKNKIASDKKSGIRSDETFILFLMNIYTKEEKEIDTIVKYRKLMTSILSTNLGINYLETPDFTNTFFNEIYNDLDEINLLEFYISLIKIADVGIDNIVFELYENTQNIYDVKKSMDSLKKDGIKSKKNISKEEKAIISIIKNLEFLSSKNNDFIKKRKKVISYRNGKKAPFDEIESDGTKIYAFHMYNIVKSLKNGSLSLHDEFYGVQPDLIKTAFLLFKKNRYKEIEQTAQLFMTTHDVVLMEFKYLLLEQIKFVVKEDNKTYVYSASDIKGLKKENLIENYKNNKLGAKYFPRAYDLPIKMYVNNNSEL